jgi:hypothetical protein
MRSLRLSGRVFIQGGGRGDTLATEIVGYINATTTLFSEFTSLFANGA